MKLVALTAVAVLLAPVMPLPGQATRFHRVHKPTHHRVVRAQSWMTPSVRACGKWPRQTETLCLATRQFRTS